MKKGNFFPRARARWVSGAYGNGQQNAPAWIKPISFYAVYIYNDGGIPTPRVVTHGELSIANWSYYPTAGQIVWQGSWFDGLFGGIYVVTQRSWWPQLSILGVKIAVTMVGGPYELGYDSYPENATGDWYRTAPTQIDCNRNTVHNDTWISMISPSFQPMPYSELRSLGIDENDTSPSTWDYSA